MKNDSRKNGNGKKKTNKSEAFYFINVRAEKNKKAGSGANGKSRKGGTEGKGAFRIKLGDDNGRSAVGDKANKAGNNGLKKTFGHHEFCKSLFADGVDANLKSKHHNKDKSKSFCGMKNGAFEKTVFTFGMTVGMFLLNGLNLLLCDVEKTETVNKKSRNDCEQKLCTDKRKDFSGALGVGKKKQVAR